MRNNREPPVNQDSYRAWNPAWIFPEHLGAPRLAWQYPPCSMERHASIETNALLWRLINGDRDAKAVCRV